MLKQFFGTKLTTATHFDKQGRQLVVTHIKTLPMTITLLKTKVKDGYSSLQVAFGQKSKKSIKKPQTAYFKKISLSFSPQHIKEIKLKKDSQRKVGDQITASDIFKVGDVVKVTAKTKGRGFAGVIKRHGFHGGPKTHGQSDRQRAPGSIGMRTDPGRVWKGKKMPGHYGVATTTITGLKVIDIDPDKHLLTISGTIPGSRNSLVKLQQN